MQGEAHCRYPPGQICRKSSRLLTDIQAKRARIRDGGLHDLDTLVNMCDLLSHD